MFPNLQTPHTYFCNSREPSTSDLRYILWCSRTTIIFSNMDILKSVRIFYQKEKSKTYNYIRHEEKHNPCHFRGAFHFQGRLND